jgi:hypothetical protein
MIRTITPNGLGPMINFVKSDGTPSDSAEGTFLQYFPPRFPDGLPSLKTVTNPPFAPENSLAFCKCIGDVSGCFLVFCCSFLGMFSTKIELMNCCPTLLDAINYAKTNGFGHRLKQGSTGALILSMADWEDKSAKDYRVSRWRLDCDYLNLFPSETPDSEASRMPPSTDVPDENTDTGDSDKRTTRLVSMGIIWFHSSAERYILEFGFLRAAKKACAIAYAYDSETHAPVSKASGKSTSAVSNLYSEFIRELGNSTNLTSDASSDAILSLRLEANKLNSDASSDAEAEASIISQMISINERICDKLETFKRRRAMCASMAISPFDMFEKNFVRLESKLNQHNQASVPPALSPTAVDLYFEILETKLDSMGIFINRMHSSEFIRRDYEFRRAKKLSTTQFSFMQAPATEIS